MDEKAKKILMSAYWGSGGWRSGKVSKADFEYARKQGLMFDRLSITHDKLVSRTIRVRDKIELDELVRAFLASLSSRLLYLRSALASYGNCAELKTHRFEPYDEPDMSYLCRHCGEMKQIKNEDLSVLNFERIKWGGVRHEDLIYNMFDLERFAETEIPERTSDDIRIFKEILRTIKSSAPDDHPGALEKRLDGVLPANKNERKMLIEMLAILGVLSPARTDRPVRGKSDWTFVEQWRGCDGYNAKVVKNLFGPLM